MELIGTTTSEPTEIFHYDAISVATTAIITWIDAYRDIWLPQNWLVRFKIYGLTSILILGNSTLAYIVYPLFAGTTGTPLGIEALLIGAGYFSVLRVLAIKLKFGEKESSELSFSSLIYEPIQSAIFQAIDELIDPFLEAEIEQLTNKLSLNELAEKVYNKIDRASKKVLDKERKDDLKQWLYELLSNDDKSVLRKKNIIAKVLVTKKYPDLQS